MSLIICTVIFIHTLPTLAESPPPLPDMKIVRFETSDGITIEGDYYPPIIKEDEKAPVAILIHMYPADRRSWTPLVPGLRDGDTRFAVLAYDIRGRGGSTEPADKNLRSMYETRDPALFKDAWKDVEAAKKWLSKQPGVDTSRIALIGASIGCSISLDYGSRDKDVKAVVCLSPGTNYFQVDSTRHIKRCDHISVLLIAPEEEYPAVEDLIAASGGKAKGLKYPGGREWHGTRMFDEKYKDHADVKKRILSHVSRAMGTDAKRQAATTP